MAEARPQPELHLPRRVCGDLAAAQEREWLVTNRLGGFAFGTVAGALTRRYHGLLIAALEPPLGRTLMATKFDEVVHADGESHALYANIWRSGPETPAGCRFIQRFEVDAGVPTWTFDVAGRRITKRIWMESGANVTYVQYFLAAALDGKVSGPIELSGRLLTNFRDYHALTPSDQRTARVDVQDDTIVVQLDSGAAPLHVRCIVQELGARTPRRRGANPASPWTAGHHWYRDFHLPFEESVGYECLDAHHCSASCIVELTPGSTATFVFAAGPRPDHSPARREPVERAVRDALDSTRMSGALLRRRQVSEALVSSWQRRSRPAADNAPVGVRQLVLAADQFVVSRPTADDSAGHTLIAGYPWFTDWGRDTMISLPGLTLATGRYEIAKQILRTWAKYVDRGMIPNRFPDAADTPEYNTVDATLWYVWAVDQYWRVTRDRDTLAELYPSLKEIVAWHVRGTRFNIRLGPDGLIYAGEPGVQLTWMDAKVDGRVITPRTGKPIEISALWYDGLRNLAEIATQLGHNADTDQFTELADVTRGEFARFWNAQRGYCYDVVDGPDAPECPGGNDDRLLPNQIFAVSLRNSPLSAEHQKKVVDAVQAQLLTRCGLRTLAPGEPRYHGRYQGRLAERDEAYHQGTVWGWLLGPFVVAHFRVYEDAAAARALLEPMLAQLSVRGVGSLAEIFDADEPHAARGCIAQAWSVAETLRAWHETQSPRRPVTPRPSPSRPARR